MEPEFGESNIGLDLMEPETGESNIGLGIIGAGDWGEQYWSKI